MTTSFNKLTLVAVATLAVTASNAATFVLSGNFGTTVYTGPLNGGSFAGTYNLTGQAIGSYDIFLRNISGNTVAELTNANSSAAFHRNYGSSGFDALQFINSPAQNILSLDFSSGFTGVGAVVPFPQGFPYTSFSTIGGQTAQTTSTVTNGFSAAVPEPAAWALFLIGGAAVISRRKFGGGKGA